MITKFLKTIEDYGMLSCGEKVLCALSGGVDSSVLLDLLVRCAGKLGITVCAAHLNHMLRGEDADKDELFVCEKCEKLGVPLFCERIDVAALAKNSGDSTELAARNARYEFLHRAKGFFGASRIATAHNANDNLETVLFNLSRGSGSDGMCGIPPVRDDIIRPLITSSRGDIEKYASENSISFCEDKTNLETVYSRNKIRHNIIPALVEVNPAAVENALRTSSLMREESAFLKELACSAAAEIRSGHTFCERCKLLRLNTALFGRVCEIFAREALGNENYTLEYRHVCDIRKLAENASPSKGINLPSGLLVRREYEKIVFEKCGREGELLPLSLSEGEHVYGEYKILVKKTVNKGKINNSVNTFCIPCDRIQDKPVARKRQEGDVIKLPKRPEKSLKKLFIENKVPKLQRSSIPVISAGDAVVAVFGFGQDERYQPSENDEVLLIEIK